MKTFHYIVKGMVQHVGYRFYVGMRARKLEVSGKVRNLDNGDVEVFEYNFRWNWENYAQTSIRMSYGPGDVSYLDDVYLGGNRLSGYLDGRDNFVEYQGSR